MASFVAKLDFLQQLVFLPYVLNNKRLHEGITVL